MPASPLTYVRLVMSDFGNPSVCRNFGIGLRVFN